MDDYSLSERERQLRNASSGSQDVIISRFRCGLTECMLCWCDGMIDKNDCFERVFRQLASIKPPKYMVRGSLAADIKNNRLLFDARTEENFALAMESVFTGYSALFIEGCAECFVFDQQGYAHRAINESYSEENVRSPREGFTEPIGINVTLVRRRLKTGKLRVEYFNVGRISQTAAALVYLEGVAEPSLIESVREKAAQIDLPAVFESGFIEPFFRERRSSVFTAVGHTERPDCFCAKLTEGRVGILVDGTPFALTMPQLFIENFQSFDDYSQKAYFSTFVRTLKLISFMAAVILPGLYVAVAMHTVELLPMQLPLQLTDSEKNIPVSIMFEALFIQLVYEIVREGGLRLPRPIGHAVSLIGALVVGETAISAGIVGAPMVMMGALTAVCSFTIPKLYQACAVLRFSFIIIGGLFGLTGISLAFCFVFFNICAIDSFGTPYAAPISPYSASLFRDGIVRKNWRILGQEKFNIKRWEDNNHEQR